METLVYKICCRNQNRQFRSRKINFGLTDIGFFAFTITLLPAILTSNSTMSTTNVVSTSGYQSSAAASVDRAVSKQYGSRVITIENPFEMAFFSDTSNRYVVKVCKINGIAKVGFTRFFWSHQYNKFIPGNACYMSVAAYRAFMSNTDLHEELEKRGHKLLSQQTCTLFIISLTNNTVYHMPFPTVVTASNEQPAGAGNAISWPVDDDEPSLLRALDAAEHASTGSRCGDVGSVHVNTAGCGTAGVVASDGAVADVVDGASSKRQRRSDDPGCSTIKEATSSDNGKAVSGCGVRTGNETAEASPAQKETTAGATKRKRGRPNKQLLTTLCCCKANSNEQPGTANTEVSQTSNVITIGANDNASDGLANATNVEQHGDGNDNAHKQR